MWRLENTSCFWAAASMIYCVFTKIETRFCSCAGSISMNLMSLTTILATEARASSGQGRNQLMLHPFWNAG